MSLENNVTLIENLPELQDLENYENSIIPPEQAMKVDKFIRRNQVSFSPQSGMGSIHHSPHHLDKNNLQYQEYSQEYSPQYHSPDSPKKYHIEQYPPSRVKEEVKTIDMPKNSPSCLDVAEHIMNCPLCSKFYHNDNTIYIITIIVLVIIVVLLLKKVLDL